MQLDEELLHSEHMKAARGLIVRKYRWLQHITTASAIPSIRRTGLEPRRDRPGMDHIIKAWGVSAEYVICLYPIGCGAQEQIGTKESPLARLAFESRELPKRLTSDWTYGTCNSEKWRALRPDLSLPEIIVKAVEERGSLVIYQSVEVDRLLVRCKTSTASPCSWPRLVDVANAEILHF